MTPKPLFQLKAFKAHIAHLSQTAKTIQRETRYGGNSDSKRTKSHKASLDPRQIRSFKLHVKRLFHVANLVSQAYVDQIIRIGGHPLQMLSSDPTRALKSKHLPLLLSIAHFTSEQQIPLSHWFRAQFDLIRPPNGCPFIPITVAHGPNAHSRYLDWHRRQASRFTRAQDRTHALDTSPLKHITQQIGLSHQFVLRQLSSSARLAPPSMELILWDLFPNISAWYLIAHDGFRKEFVESGACLAPTVVEHYAQYKRNRKIRDACHRALLSATDAYGDYPCILSHFEQV